MDSLLKDIRYAFRLLVKRPGFSAVIIATLALGIGANAALFSVVNGVLLNPLPYPEPEQLVTLHQSKPNFETGAVPYPNFLDMQRENQTFTALAISRSAGYSLMSAGEPERVRGRLISADFFKVLGIQPELGRYFTSEDDKAGGTPVALISTELWSRKFSTSPDVIGKSMTLDDRSYSIVGVVPPSLKLLANVDVYTPIGQLDSPALKNRAVAFGLHGIGRMKPGVSFEQAQSDLSRIMGNLAIAFPGTNKDNDAKIVRMKDRLVGGIEPILWTLLGAVGFVLLIACVNVSNLMLARATGRTREFAIRAALGAARWRLLRQSMVESVVLALIGGTLGLTIATWGTKLALAALPTTLPRADEIGVDSRVLLFTVVVSLLTGLLAGLAPALKTSQWRFSETLKETGRGSTAGRLRAQGVFVAVEMALALVLLIGAGLMLRSLSALWHVDPGFNPDNVMTLGLDLPPSTRTASATEVRNTLRQLSDKIGSTPGVDSASFLVGAAPMQSEDDLNFWIEGEPKPSGPSDMHMALFYVVEPGYLKAMSLSLKRGRFFTDQDTERSAQVAVIDDAFASKYFNGTEPLGKRINLNDTEKPFEIVGVVGHVKQFGLDSDTRESLQAQIYFPFRSMTDQELEGGVPGISVVFRSREGNEPPNVFGSVRQRIKDLNNQNIISRPQTLNKVISGSLSTQRFSMALLGSFAAVALLLASLGVYGVVSYLVGQRTHELGIRIALGASRRDIMGLVLKHGMKMTLAGVGIGLVASFGLTRLMTKMLFGVSATDPATFILISGLLALVAFLACYLPARRATKVDPLVALRYE